MFDYELMGMKAAQYMLDMLQDQEAETNMDMPLFFVERESVRNLMRDYHQEKPVPMTGLD